MSATLDLGNLLIRISASATGFYATIAGVNTTLARSIASMERAGARMSVIFTAPLAKIGQSVAQTVVSFDQSMTKALAVMGGVGTGMRERMEEAARAISRDSVHTPEALAEAYLHLAQAGLSAEQSMASLKPIADFATGAMLDLEKATQLLVQSQAALGLASQDPQTQLENLERMTNVLTKAANSTTASAESLASALTNKSASAARVLGKDVEETVAVLSTFAKVGVHAETAGERLDILWRDLGAAVNKQSANWAKLGLQVYDATGNFRNTADILQDIGSVLAPLSDQQKTLTLAQLGFQYRSVSVVKQLLGQHEAMRQFEADLRSAGDESRRLANDQMDSLASKLANLNALWSDAKLALQEEFATALTYVIEKGKELLRWWNQLTPSTQKWIAIFGAATAVVGPALLLFGGLAASLSAISGIAVTAATAFGGIVAPIVAITAAVGAAVYAFSQLGSWLESFTSVHKAANDELERSKALSNRMIGNRTTVQNERFSQLTSIANPVERQSAIKKELETATALAKSLQDAMKLDPQVVGGKEAEAYVKRLQDALSRTEQEAKTLQVALPKVNDVAEEQFEKMAQAAERAADAILNVGNDIVLLELKLRGVPDDLAKGMQQIAELRNSGAGPDQVSQLEQLIQKRHELTNELERQSEVEQQLSAMKSEAEALTESLMTPVEKFREQLARLQTLRSQGLISEETFKRGANKLGAESMAAIGGDQSQKSQSISAISYVDSTTSAALAQFGGLNSERGTAEDKMVNHLAEISRKLGNLESTNKQVAATENQKLLLSPLQIRNQPTVGFRKFV